MMRSSLLAIQVEKSSMVMRLRRSKSARHVLSDDAIHFDDALLMNEIEQGFVRDGLAD